MKQEDKELLLRDLCAILPYGVKVSYIADDYEHDVVSIHTQLKNAVRINGKRPSSKYDKGPEIVESWTDVKCIKPYLYPLSSMTKEQKRELHNIQGVLTVDFELEEYKMVHLFQSQNVIDWLNKNHFDYRGLIAKGLAIDATGLDIYKED